MRSLIVVTGYNRTGINPRTGRPWVDATGAFLPEAHAFRRLHGEAELVDGHNIPRAGWLEFVAPLTPARRRGLAEASIRAAATGLDVLDVLAVFGHGISSNLLVTGHGPAQVLDLASAIHASGAKNRRPVRLQHGRRTGRVRRRARRGPPRRERLGSHVRRTHLMEPEHRARWRPPRGRPDRAPLVYARMVAKLGLLPEGRR